MAQRRETPCRAATWLLGTHAGAFSHKHLQAYLDKFA